MFSIGLILLGHPLNSDGAEQKLKIEQIRDADGQCVGKRITTRDPLTGTTQVQEQHYLLETLNPTGYSQIAAVIDRDNDNNPWNLRQRRLHGHSLIGTAPGRDAQGHEENPRHLLLDGHGSVRSEWNDLGPVTGNALYTAWGERVGASPTNTSPGVQAGYVGEVWDAELGLYDLRARSYVPQWGRLTTADTFEGYPQDPLSRHRYLYCQNNPVNLIDPSGYFVSSGETGTAISMAGTLQTLGRSVVASAYLAHTVYFDARGMYENHELSKIARSLGIGVEQEASLYDLQNETEWSDAGRRRGDGAEHFAHGSSTGAWKGSTIQAMGGGDFGTGFYTFSCDAQGLYAAGGRAIGTSSNPRFGGRPFILVVKIDQSDFADMLNKSTDLRGASTRWTSTVTGYLNRGGHGFSGTPLMIGPVSVQGRRLNTGESARQRTSMPDQWKWEDVTKLKPSAIIPDFNSFSQSMAW